MKTVVDPAREVYDKEWFSRIKEIDPSLTKRLRTRNFIEAKKDFYRGSSSEPNAHYYFLEEDSYHTVLRTLDTFANEVSCSSSVPDAVVSLYLDKIKERILQFRLLELSKQIINGKKAINETKEIIHQLYGEPDKNVFYHLLSVLYRKTENIPETVKASQQYEKILKVLECYQETTIKDLEPISAKVFSDKVYLEAEEVKGKVEEALQKAGLHRWRVIISRSKVGGFVVWPLTRFIVVPSTKMLKARVGNRILTEAGLQAMIQHEVLTHAIRAENGARSPLRLLSVGLAAYTKGEEGIATYREQRILGADDYTNQNFHFAIGVALGLDRSGEHRTFRETFEVLKDYFYVFHYPDEAKAREKSFVACERIFKGCSGEGTAFIFSKDVAYREGNIAVHHLLEENPDAEKWFDIGKFDPTNQDHVKRLKELSIIS